MKIIDEKIQFSPTDLNNFVSCKYIIKNDLLAKDLKLQKKDNTADQKLRIEHGNKHEKNYLKILKDKYKKNITIDPKQPSLKKFKDTIDALKEGYDLIYKAYLRADDFGGELDFLLKTKEKSKLGNYSYEVYDTKVTKNLKPNHVLQITGYSYLLGEAQGLMPTKMHLIDGSDNYNSYKVSEFVDYFLYTKKNFEEFLPKAKKNNLYPEKCSFCKFCDWKDVCEKKWEKDNYINQVCGIKSTQIVKLKKENITTVEALAKTDPEKIKAKINLTTKIKINKQAKLQEEKRITNVSKYIFNETQKDKGFYKMPIPNEGDLFYDIEGFPQAGKRNFEYLHGIYYNNGEKKI